MKLVHKATGKEVQVGDRVVDFRGDAAYVQSFDKPHKPSSCGHVNVVTSKRALRSGTSNRYYVSVFDMEWVDREDRC